MKWGILFLMFMLAGCAYRNPLEKADFRFQTVMVPPYVLSSWYHISATGDPLVVYVENDEVPLTDNVRKQVVQDSSSNVAYIGRPCQYLQTTVCQQKLTSAESDRIVQKGIEQLQKKAATKEVIVKGMK